MIASAAVIALALGAAAPAPGWITSDSVDPISGAHRQGLGWKSGDDGFVVVCTHQKDGRGRQRFWVAVQTGEPLGRAKENKPLTYRVGEDEPITSRWDYSPREVVPSWPLEDRHMIERVIAAKAEKIAFRISLYDGRTHDVTVPIDADAREQMAQTIENCRTR